jgi:hypothetical protein
MGKKSIITAFLGKTCGEKNSLWKCKLGKHNVCHSWHFPTQVQQFLVKLLWGKKFIMEMYIRKAQRLPFMVIPNSGSLAAEGWEFFLYYHYSNSW